MPVDVSECSEPVPFGFKNPISIVERVARHGERHWNKPHPIQLTKTTAEAEALSGRNLKASAIYAVTRLGFAQCWWDQSRSALQGIRRHTFLSSRSETMDEFSDVDVPAVSAAAADPIEGDAATLDRWFDADRFRLSALRTLLWYLERKGIGHGESETPSNSREGRQRATIRRQSEILLCGVSVR